ncbi:MAG: 30S ribosomal protein S7 [Candidatus Peregrinibacteria bacterium]|nr:30S ribosomal protein S7 [Candidatus Peregrinibacteria bacterium]
MTDETKVAASEAASKNSDKSAKVDKSVKPEKKPKVDKKFNNPFSFTDELQAKFVNCIMKNGKKTVAQQILKDTFTELNRKGQKDALKTFENAIANATPTMEVKPKRIGGSIYQIPREVTPKRQQTLSIRWILAGARSRKGMPMYKRLSLEILDAANETGSAFNKREEAHKMAQANKAFAHLARY